MNPWEAYQQHGASEWTRIDLLLALYDGAIDRLERGRAAFEVNDAVSARVHVVRAQRIVAEIMAGLDMSYGEICENLLRLYSFVLSALAVGNIHEIDASLRVLRVLREGLLGIQAEAIQLERTGTIPPIGEVHALEATA